MLTITDLISESISLYKKHVTSLIIYGATITLISFVMTGLVTGITVFGFDITNLKDMLNVASPIYYGTVFVLYIIAMVLISIATIALIRVIYKIHNQQPVGTYMAEIMETKPVIIPSILVSILISLIVLGGILLLIIPGIIFSVWYTFASISVIVDNKRVGESLTFSKALVKGRWFQTFAYIVVPFLVFLLVELAISGIIHIPSVVSTGNTFVIVIVDILDLATSIVLSPLYTIPFVILYTELKKNPVTPEIPAQN